MEWFEWALQQAYIYIPTILGVISSIGIPALVSLAKILSNVKLYLAQAQVLLKKVNEVVDVAQSMSSQIEQLVDLIIAQNELIANATLNKKVKEQSMMLTKQATDVKANFHKQIEKATNILVDSKKSFKVKVKQHKERA
ncbi:MAG: hypothetical protein M0R51_13770 [Clostridia bacterium]|jgi:hypothetical protein|nr:hypothetical protein [Clostridia bacterium]